MKGINYEVKGKWYIQKNRDLHDVRNLLSEFYYDSLNVPKDNSSKYRLIYDRDLQLLKIKSYSKGRNRTLLISVSDYDEVVKRVALLFDTIVAMGIVNAPFYYVDVLFDANNSHRNSYLESKGGTGRNRGYYSLIGKIYSRGSKVEKEV